MHILATTSTTLEDLAEPVDLAQPPGDMVALSFTDSDLLALSAAWRARRDSLPSLRLARLKDLTHPMSVDLWVEKVARHAKVVLVRQLGGLDWWRYGAEQLSALARARGIALALLPGEDQDDPRLAALSTLPADELAQWLAYFRAGGPDNMGALLARMAATAGFPAPAAIAPPRPVPATAFYRPGAGLAEPQASLAAAQADGRASALILFYRSQWLAADTAAIDALAAALEARGIAAVPLFVPSLKAPEARAAVRHALAALKPAVIVTTTAFAAGDAAELFPAGGPPVLQAAPATTARAAWAGSPRGLSAADLAMHVVLPELDGRVLAGALSFKDFAPADADLAFAPAINRPEPEQVAHVADRVAGLVRLAATPRAERRLALILPDYPGAEGRSGYAVGLDVPESARRLIATLGDAGYATGPMPADAKALLAAIAPAPALSLDAYRRAFDRLPQAAREAVLAAWGAPEADADLKDGAFHFRIARFSALTLAFAPDRGAALDRRADYHDAALPPRHALIAFGLWLREGLDAHAVIHLGAHGTLEWLPGKAVALTPACFPQVVMGALPVVYPFIVSNPGEAAQAKRRLAAVTIGHLPPPLAAAGLSEAEQKLERLVDEYAQADGLDRRRRERLAQLIVETAGETGLAGTAGVTTATDPDEALRRIDAWLCDLKDLAVKDGLHVFGHVPQDEADPARLASAGAETRALLDALDGRFVPAGPAGAPARGRRDVLPTGRNLYTADPRTLPTPTACDLARKAADEALRLLLQEHGDWPRALVLDLWGSASLRTGGEEIAQGLAFLGCRPMWEAASGRVTGIEVLPPAVLGRPRIDVTFRISGLFRDIFPAQIALLDAAVRAVAARDEDDAENPLAAARRRGEDLSRLFGSAPGAYGAGIEAQLQRGAFEDRAELGHAYLAAASHAYGGADGVARPAPGAFAGRIATADALIHGADDAARDLLDGSEDAAFMGGFAAAGAALGRKAHLVVLDTTDPDRPRARPLSEALARLVYGRVSATFITGQMRHGPRGAAELAETVDRLVAFAETTQEVASALLDRLHAAYLAEPSVRAFLLDQNPAAARAMARRFADARRRGLWHSRRNALDADLDALLAEAAAPREAAPQENTPKEAAE
ncbi:cobaltochelatase subunit CobN [Xanthobacter autotrophicus]|uniref:cobaltochelatase subunit CobN n=1 Tax=Xanthobacter autotrophicus TaxID=280 RepID=UPI0024A64DE8|nr:cobaltochelatase subunit CobN [Xanthobacter autotrophicus]MDI4658341.1 cobaltochelatase subunit CobN [Xanthobacter autotrophicus]